MAVNTVKVPGRQTVLHGQVAFTYADFTSGTALEVMDMPEGAVVVGGSLIVDTAWNSATSAAFDVGDLNSGGTADPDRYEDGQDVKTAAGIWPLTITGYKFTTRDAITMTLVEVGAATAGAGRLYVDYVIEDRANETQSLQVTNYGAARQ